jgi:hypothetical protein
VKQLTFEHYKSFNARLLVLEAQSLAEWEKALAHLLQAPLQIPHLQWANQSIYLYFFEHPETPLKTQTSANSLWVAREYIGMELDVEKNQNLGLVQNMPFSYDLFPGEFYSFAIEQWPIERPSALNLVVLGELVKDCMAFLNAKNIQVATTWRLAWDWHVPFGACRLEFFRP